MYRKDTHQTVNNITSYPWWGKDKHFLLGLFKIFVISMYLFDIKTFDKSNSIRYKMTGERSLEKNKLEATLWQVCSSRNEENQDPTYSSKRVRKRKKHSSALLLSVLGKCFLLRALRA